MLRKYFKHGNHLSEQEYFCFNETNEKLKISFYCFFCFLFFFEMVFKIAADKAASRRDMKGNL